MPEVPGYSDPSDVKRARKKYLTIMRTKRRLENRLADIDWELDVLQPGLEALEQRITVLGELPEFNIVDETADDGRSDQ